MKNVISGVLMAALLVVAPVAMAADDGVSAGSDDAASALGIGEVGVDLIVGGIAAAAIIGTVLAASNSGGTTSTTPSAAQ